MRYDELNLNLVDPNKRINEAQKKIDDTFLYSDVSWGLELSEGDRPADPFLPDRFSPTVRVVKTSSYHRKGVVIPRGTILAARPVMNQNYYWRTPAADSQPFPASGETYSGEVALGIGYDSNPLSTNVEDMVGGFDNIRLAGVIANGGIAAGNTYAAYDVERGRVDESGSLVATTDSFVRPINIPIGIVTEDTYILDDGNKLNFNEISWNKFRSYQTDFFVELPYCAEASKYTMNNTAAVGVQTMGAGYAAAWALGVPFLAFDSLSDMQPGVWIKSDLNGKFLQQYKSGGSANFTAIESFANPHLAAKTNQTVGKLNSFSNKYPEDLEGLVETYHTTQTGGTATYGIKYQLFHFMRAILKANLGSEPKYADYRDALDSGAFGLARINLHVS